MGTPIDIHISLKNLGETSDPEATWKQFVDEINHLDGIRVEGIHGKSNIGDLLVTLASATVLQEFVKSIALWLGRDKTRTLKFQIGDRTMEASGLTRDEQMTLIDWFQKHSSTILRP